MTGREINTDAIFGRDDYADYLAQQAEEQFAGEEDEQGDDDPDPPTPAAPMMRIARLIATNQDPDAYRAFWVDLLAEYEALAA